MNRRANSFWRFSLRIYRVPGVAEACLALQDRCGADVNVLLFCAWAGHNGRVLDATSLRCAVDRVGDWQSAVIAPLRLARRGLKRQAADATIAALAAPLRQRILALELELERVEQSLLADLESQWPPPSHAFVPSQAIASNMTVYLALLGHAAGADERAQLACIERACRPTASADLA